MAKAQRKSSWAYINAHRAMCNDELSVIAFAKVFGLTIAQVQTWPLKNPRQRTIQWN